MCSGTGTMRTTALAIYFGLFVLRGKIQRYIRLKKEKKEGKKRANFGEILYFRLQNNT